MSTYRILLADDHVMIREGLRRLLDDSRELAVVGEASDGHEALRLARELLPDVVVMDLSMPGLDGLEVTKQLCRELPRVNVLVLTMHASQEYAFRLLKAGARGFIGKGEPSHDLIMAILKVARGDTFLSHELLETIPRRLVGAEHAGGTLETLSDRELQVLQLLAGGLTGREIGQRLYLSVKTIDTYRARLLTKLGLNTTADLIRFALRHRVIEDAW